MMRKIIVFAFLFTFVFYCKLMYAQSGESIAWGGFIDGQCRFEDCDDGQSNVFQIRRARLD